MEDRDIAVEPIGQGREQADGEKSSSLGNMTEWKESGDSH